MEKLKLPEYPTECPHSIHDSVWCQSCIHEHQTAVYKCAVAALKRVTDLEEERKLEDLRHKLWYDNCHIAGDIYMKQEAEVLRLRSAIQAIKQALFGLTTSNTAEVVERIHAIIKDVMFQVS